MTETLLYETYNATTRRSTEIVTDSETGLPVIIQVQDLKPIIEANKRQANAFDRHVKRPDDITHVARIPMVIWQRLMRMGIAKDPKALNRWLDERDNRVFRTDDARKL